MRHLSEEDGNGQATASVLARGCVRNGDRRIPGRLRGRSGGPPARPARPAPPALPALPALPAHPAPQEEAARSSVGSNGLTNPDAIAANAAGWADLQPTVTITSVTIASPPVVKFTVFDSFGKAVVGLGNTSKSATAVVASYPNLSFALAKLVPGTSGAPSKWVSYIVTSCRARPRPSAAPSRPSTDNTGTLVDNGDGSYNYTFYRDVTTVKTQLDGMTVSPPNNIADLGDVSYNPTLTHRVTIALSGNAPGDRQQHADRRHVERRVGADEAPGQRHLRLHSGDRREGHRADFSREVVSVANCEACHRQLGGIPGLSEAEDAAGFHGGSRNETQYCVVCHTDQRRYGQKEATFTSNGAIRTFTSETRLVDGRTVGNFPNYIHKIHMGPLLVHENYDYAGVLPAETTYPQDIRNCTSCHDGSSTVSRTTKTKDGDNWKTKPSRAGLRRLPRRHQLRDRHRRHAEGQGRRPDAVEHQRHRPRAPGRPAARRLAMRALPQVERHVPAGRHRPEPLPGDAAESGQRAGRRRRQREHELRMDRLGRLGRAAAAGRDRADLRSAERLAQRAASNR